MILSSNCMKEASRCEKLFQARPINRGEKKGESQHRDAQSSACVKIFKSHAEKLRPFVRRSRWSNRLRSGGPSGLALESVRIESLSR